MKKWTPGMLFTCKFCGTQYERWNYYDGPEHGFETEAFISDCCERCWYSDPRGFPRPTQN
jgi:hypothetical protein